jgi:hypothetical protein
LASLLNAIRQRLADEQHSLFIIVLRLSSPATRIPGKDGAMTGHGGGIARKKWLLEHEAKYQYSAESP